MKYLLFIGVFLGIFLSCGVENTIHGKAERGTILPCTVSDIGSGLMITCPDGTQAMIPNEAQTNFEVGDHEEEVTEPTPPEEPISPLRITICHKPGTPAEKTMEIPVNALKGHLKHGDYVGACNG